RVLEPLGMSSTGSPGPTEDIGKGYTPTGRIIPSADRPFAGVGAQVGERHLREYHDAAAMSPAFGAYTTARDLSRIIQFLLGYGGQGMLSNELRRDLLTPQSSSRSFGLGTGTFRGRPVARHGGWFAAHKSHILIDLDSETGVIVIANSDSADADAIAKILLGAVLDSVDNSDQQGDSVN
ncbi:MAG: serine hydrolase, partial [Gammaproteobacteria bacterium]|nr:serine hydrolase [Gammaproteobacteria bacterium]